MGNVESWIPSWLFDYESFEQNPNESFRDIGLAALFNSIVGFTLFVYFTVKRWNKPSHFSPKREAKPPELPGPQCGLFKWIKALYDINEAEYLQFAGYDALIYIRMYLLALKISIAVSIYAFSVVLPLNITGGNLMNQPSIGEFSDMSISNISGHDNALWAHVIGLMQLTVAAFYFLNKEFMVYTRLRHSYLKLRSPYMRTVMLEGVPPEMRSAAQIYVYFNTLYANSIASVSCIQDLRMLRNLLEKRNKTLAELERLLLKKSKVEATKHDGDLVVTICCCAYNLSEKIESLKDRLNELNASIKLEQSLRIQRLQMVDRRILNEIEAGGYLANVSFRPSEGLKFRTPDRNQVNAPPNPAVIEEYLVHIGGRLGIGYDYNDPLNVVDDPIFTDSSGTRRFSINRKSFTEGISAGINALSRMKNALKEIFSMSYLADKEGERQALLPPAPTSKELELTGMGSKAFVTFKTFGGATVARQVHHTSKVGTLRALQAPEPRDIYWENAHINPFLRTFREYLVDLFLTILYIFWVVPATGLYLLISEEALASRFEWVAETCAENSYYCTAIGTIQPVILLGLMNLLPPLILFLGKLEGSAAISWNQKKGLSRYFNFQIINIFLVTTIAGTIFQTLEAIIDSPSKALTLLGESLPAVCGFFCEYILIKMLSGLMLEISRIFSLIQHFLFVLVLPNETKRDRREVKVGLRRYENPGWFNYSKYFAQDLLVVVITFTFACINPFILVVSIPYYASAYIIYKHQMLYVYEPIYESGGTYFPKVFRRFIFAIFVAQATMVGVFILKGAYYQAGAVGILVLLTWIFKSQQRGSFESVSDTLPLEIATILDMESEEQVDESVQYDARNPYVQPELRAKPTLQPEPQD